MRLFLTSLAAALATAVACPAAAEVVASSENGFISHNVVEVPASLDAAWAMLPHPSEWWNGEHSYSGSAANLTIETVAGGCFCETIPAANGAAAGQVEHMRVVYIDPRDRTLRLVGALGPLQAEAVTGVLTITVEPSGSASKITWDYVVGGYMRRPMSEMAPLVDKVVREQLTRLGAALERS
jgi:hypothetical protein